MYGAGEATSAFAKLLRCCGIWIRGSGGACVAPSGGSGRPAASAFAEMVKRGVRRRLAADTAGAHCGPWRVSQSPALDQALSNAYLASIGLPSLVEGRQHD